MDFNLNDEFEFTQDNDSLYFVPNEYNTSGADKSDKITFSVVGAGNAINKKIPIMAGRIMVEAFARQPECAPYLAA